MTLPIADWVIFHNPRCSKSREALALLKRKKIDPLVVEYLQSPLKIADLKELCERLGVEAGNLLRKKEAIISEENLDLSSNSKIIDAIATYPNLMERPVVMHKKRAVIARPPEKLLDLL